MDRRNLIPGILENSEHKQTIVRSVYLQGLFSIVPSKLSEFHQPLKPLTEKLRQIAESFGIGINEMALRYILAYSPDYIVIGVESVKQFQSNLTWFRKGPLKKNIMDQINAISYDLDFKLITPYQWLTKDFMSFQINQLKNHFNKTVMLSCQIFWTPMN